MLHQVGIPQRIRGKHLIHAQPTTRGDLSINLLTQTINTLEAMLQTRHLNPQPLTNRPQLRGDQLLGTDGPCLKCIELPLLIR